MFTPKVYTYTLEPFQVDQLLLDTNRPLRLVRLTINEFDYRIEFSHGTRSVELHDTTPPGSDMDKITKSFIHKLQVIQYLSRIAIKSAIADRDIKLSEMIPLSDELSYSRVYLQHTTDDYLFAIQGCFSVLRYFSSNKEEHISLLKNLDTVITKYIDHIEQYRNEEYDPVHEDTK